MVRSLYTSGAAKMTQSLNRRASCDVGKTWTIPKELVAKDKGGRGPVKNKPILLSSGAWLAPASLEGPTGNKKGRVWRAFFDRSEDQGYTWTKSPDVYPQEAGWGIIQPTIWESPEGNVHALMRSSKGIES